jgi:hypothetical protein
MRQEPLDFKLIRERSLSGLFTIGRCRGVSGTMALHLHKNSHRVPRPPHQGFQCALHIHRAPCCACRVCTTVLVAFRSPSATKLPPSQPRVAPCVVSTSPDIKVRPPWSSFIFHLLMCAPLTALSITTRLHLPGRHCVTVLRRHSS